MRMIRNWRDIRFSRLAEILMQIKDEKTIQQQQQKTSKSKSKLFNQLL